jgi:hypothetical protein
VRIEMNAHVSLTFSLKYLVNFSKSASLCGKVQLMMSNDVPLLVSVNGAFPLPVSNSGYRYHTISGRDISGITSPRRSAMTSCTSFEVVPRPTHVDSCICLPSCRAFCWNLVIM